MINSIYSNMNDSAIRRITSKVELFNGSTLLNTFRKEDYLQSVEIARQGTKGKFFGFGVCQQATVMILDKNREFNIEKGQKLKIYFSAATEEDFLKIGPSFIVSSVERDEITNTIKIVAYDSINSATSHSISEVRLPLSYTVKDVVERIASFLGISINITDEAFNLYCISGANFSGNETLRAVLDAAAEVTQTIYYINHNEELIFKTLNVSGAVAHSINKSAYFDLQVKDSITISNICNANELGDNVIAGDNSGATQYVRENPFWANRTDLAELLNEAVNRIQGLSINQFNLKWRGNFLLEIGDSISIQTNNTLGVPYIFTFVLDDVIKFSGGLSETTSWEYTAESEGASVNNPITIGEKLNQTSAKVDKVNKEISLVVQDVQVNSARISVLDMTTSEINLRVEKIENNEIEIDVDLENDTNFIELKERVSQLELTDSSITASVSSLESKLNIANSTMQMYDAVTNERIDETIATTNEKISQLELTDSSITASVSTLETTLRGEIQAGDAGLTGEIAGVKENVSSLQVKAGAIEASVSTLESTTATNLENAISSMGNNLTELEEALRAEYTDADTILSNSIDSEFVAIREDIATFSVETSGITASVSSLQKITEQNDEQIRNEIAALSKEVNLKIDSEAVEISIEKALSEGVDKVKTSSKNYTFDDAGLNIKSSDSEFNTTVNEDGMRIYKHNTEVLTANNQGVTATDLHARTFLIIGENSRLEDRGRRTACFWIGPAEE